jgi:hypothetical protein
MLIGGQKERKQIMTPIIQKILQPIDGAMDTDDEAAGRLKVLIYIALLLQHLRDMKSNQLLTIH